MVNHVNQDIKYFMINVVDQVKDALNASDAVGGDHPVKVTHHDYTHIDRSYTVSFRVYDKFNMVVNLQLTCCNRLRWFSRGDAYLFTSSVLSNDIRAIFIEVVQRLAFAAGGL